MMEVLVLREVHCLLTAQAKDSDEGNFWAVTFAASQKTSKTKIKFVEISLCLLRIFFCIS